MFKTERNRFTEVRNDLQVAIESISARGPFINMDVSTTILKAPLRLKGHPPCSF